MRPSSIFATLSLAFACQACSDAPAYPEELAAVESFYSRITRALLEQSENPGLDSDEALEKHRVFEDWDDWREAERDVYVVEYANETIVFAITIQSWLMQGESGAAQWQFRSAVANSGNQVIAILPNGQELALQVSRGETGWAIDQIDPVYLETVDRHASLEEFSLSFVRCLLELEAALPAVFLMDYPEEGPLVYYSSQQQFRLVNSTQDRPSWNQDGNWNPYWTESYRWSSALHRARRNGWKSELSIYDVIEHEGGNEVYFILRFSENGKTVAPGEILQVFVYKEEGGWYVDLYADWESHAIFEFRNDGQGNWNYQPPKSD